MSVQIFSFLTRLEVAEKFMVVVVGWKIHSLYVVVQTSCRVQLKFKLNIIKFCMQQIIVCQP